MLRPSSILPLCKRSIVSRKIYSSPASLLLSQPKSIRTPVSTLLYPRGIQRCALHTAMQKPLDFHAGPLVWIDCEMTGLDPRKDKILEIAVNSIQITSRTVTELAIITGPHYKWKPWAGWRRHWICDSYWEEVPGTWNTVFRILHVIKKALGWYGWVVYESTRIGTRLPTCKISSLLTIQ